MACCRANFTFTYIMLKWSERWRQWTYCWFRAFRSTSALCIGLFVIYVAKHIAQNQVVTDQWTVKDVKGIAYVAMWDSSTAADICREGLKRMLTILGKSVCHLWADVGSRRSVNSWFGQCSKCAQMWGADAKEERFRRIKLFLISWRLILNLSVLYVWMWIISSFSTGHCTLQTQGDSEVR